MLILYVSVPPTILSISSHLMPSIPFLEHCKPIYLDMFIIILNVSFTRYILFQTFPAAPVFFIIFYSFPALMSMIDDLQSFLFACSTFSAYSFQYIGKCSSHFSGFIITIPQSHYNYFLCASYLSLPLSLSLSPPPI